MSICPRHPMSPRTSYAAGDDCRACLVEEGLENAIPAVEVETCEHGLSADLCAGPGHYPTDEQMARGFY